MDFLSPNPHRRLGIKKWNVKLTFKDEFRNPIKGFIYSYITKIGYI